jgi:hypothetical protein
MRASAAMASPMMMKFAFYRRSNKTVFLVSGKIQPVNCVLGCSAGFEEIRQVSALITRHTATVLYARSLGKCMDSLPPQP